MVASVMLAPVPFQTFGGGMARKARDAKASLDDAALVRQFQSGVDPAGAIEVLFERYALTSFAFFCRSVGDRRRAEDLNQELFLEVIKGLPRFRHESSFKTWFFRLAYNHLSNLRRRLRTRLDERPAEPPTELWEQLIPDPGEATDERLAVEEDAMRLRRCLARLPEIERAVILGRYYHDVTLQQLTDELKLTNNSGARAYLIAGQRKLRRCMERSASRRAQETLP